MTPTLQKNKIILIDNGTFMFRSIFSWKLNKRISATWLYMRSLLATLKRLELHPDDIIIVAVDSSKGSWRRLEDSSYKANRKELREKHTDIDWSFMFNSFNTLLVTLDKATPFHFICIDELEADDIIAYSCKFFKDNEVIIVSSDSDFEMLTVHPNVRIFSPVSKKFKLIKNPYQLLSKKIEEEKTDNLISPIITQQDYETRLKIVNLINLPTRIERKVDIELSEIDFNKQYDLQLLPLRFSIKDFMDIYNKQIKTKEKKIRKNLQKSLN